MMMDYHDSRSNKHKDTSSAGLSMSALTIAINAMVLHLYSVQGSFHVVYIHFSTSVVTLLEQKCSIMFIFQKPM